MKLFSGVSYPLILTIFLSLIIPCQVVAERPNAPQVLDQVSGGCSPSTEICGDGIDQDCNGIDALCSGTDSDLDGYADNVDCTPSDRTIYPGVSVQCDATCGQGTQTCQANGQFSTCSCTTLCEKTGTGRCFYVSALTGSDTANGAYTSPWKSVLNFVSYNTAGERPAGWVQLQPGDVVYFMSGVYGDTYTSQPGKLSALRINNLNGTAANHIKFKAYPGANPVFAPEAQTEAIHINNSSYIDIEGLEIYNAYGSGIILDGGSNYSISRTRIRGVDGIDNNDVAGLRVQNVTNADVHHNLIHDNYDRTNADTGGVKTEDSRNIVAFTSNDFHLHHNIIFQSPLITATKTGGCVTFKYGSNVDSSTFEVDNNILSNCFGASIGSASRGTKIHNNLILNSDPIQFKNYGGPTYHQDNIVEFNTIVGGGGLNYEPSSTTSSIGSLLFKNNLIIDSRSYGATGGTLNIGSTLANTIYNSTVTPTNLILDRNCYYSTGSAFQADLFGVNTPSTHSSGGVYSFANWKSFGYDTGSVNTNPQLDSSYYPQTQSCQAMGHRGVDNMGGGSGNWTASAGLLFPDGIEPGDPSVCEAPAGKRCWYVDAAAPNGGNGSYASPYNSFEVVGGYWSGGNYNAGLISGGDYLYIKGTFAASRNNDISKSMRIKLERGFMGGTATQPTVIKSYRGSARAVFDGEGVLGEFIVIRGSAATPFNGIKIQNIELKNHNGKGIVIDEYVVNAEVINYVGHDGLGEGNSGVGGAITFFMRDSLHKFRIRNSLIYRNNLTPQGSINNIGGICMVGEPSALTGSTIYIHDNIIHDELRAVRHKHSGNVITEAYNNIIYNSTTGFYLRSLNNKIHNNIIYDSTEAFQLEPENQTGNASAEIYNNTVYNCSSMLSTGLDIVAYERKANLHDNIFSNPSASDGIITLGLYSSTSYNLSDWRSSYNMYYFNTSTTKFLYHQGVQKSFSQAMPYLGDTTSSSGAVGFVDAANHDFRLTPTSRAVGAGTEGIDVGAIPLN